MKKDIILAGVGGQGILSIAAIIGQAALNQNLHIKQAEVHGMSQRGGDVQSNLRISSEPIHSDLIAMGRADAIISLEPMEALRYIPYLSAERWIVVNSVPHINIPNYPETESLEAEFAKMPNVISFDADAVARDNGGVRTVNMVLLGAASLILGIEDTKLEEAIGDIFGRKGEKVVETNVNAFRAGRAAGKEQMQR